MRERDEHAAAVRLADSHRKTAEEELARLRAANADESSSAALAAVQAELATLKVLCLGFPPVPQQPPPDVCLFVLLRNRRLHTRSLPRIAMDRLLQLRVQLTSTVMRTARFWLLVTKAAACTRYVCATVCVLHCRALNPLCVCSGWWC